MEKVRILYYVPMIHSVKDISDLGPIIRDLRERIYGEKAFTQDERAIEELWGQIRTWVLQKLRDPREVVIYQDGFPIITPREQMHKWFELVLGDFPESRNFQLIKELLEMGAVLEGTEDISALVARRNAYGEIYEVAKNCRNLQEAEEFIVRKVEELDNLIAQADRLIAKRIDKTLPEGGRGILFMGHRHKVDEELVEMQRAGLLTSPIEIRKLQLRIEKVRE